MDITIQCSEKHLSSRKYVLDILFKERWNLDYSLEVHTDGELYSILLDGRCRVVLEDHFFKDLGEAYQEHHLPRDVHWFRSSYQKMEVPVFYGQPEIYKDEEALHLKMDIIAMLFFALSRWEETLDLPCDQYGRVLEEHLFMTSHGLDHRPIVDELELFLAHILQSQGLKIESRRTYQALATHDIDIHHYIRGVGGAIQLIAGDVLKRKRMDYALWTMKQIAMKAVRNKDPYDQIETLIEENEKHNLRSIFYFIPRKKKNEGASYRLSDPSIQEWITMIRKNGCDIGIHPSIGTASSAARMHKEYDAFYQSLGFKAKETRQHFLQWKPDKTVQILEEIGPLVDSSHHLRMNGGFRSGTSVEFPLFNFETQKASTIRERPLIFMDQNLQKTEMSEEDFITRLQGMIDQVKRVKGTFTFLWHNSSFHHPEWSRLGFRYSDLLDMI